MASDEETNRASVLLSVAELKIFDGGIPAGGGDAVDGVQVSCFTEAFDDVTLHFQIVRLPKQIYVWVGCNSSRFGNLYAAASTRPSNTVSVTSVLGGTSDNTGSGIARRLALKTGLNIILACNIPKNSPMLEANAEKALVRKLIDLGYTKSISDVSPTHYIVKVESFSQLAKHAIERYETGSFKAGGYKWKLVLYPNGNKNKNVKDHVSLYLALADSNSLRPGWEVCAVFRLYLLDQNKDSYLIIQETAGNERRFHGLKREWGFDKFIPVGTFGDAYNGYLVEDTCVFGADVFVSKEQSTGRGECLSMIKDAAGSKHLWRVENVSTLAPDCYHSNAFFSGDKEWMIKLYPKGRGQGTGTHVSLYLELVDSENLPAGTKVFAEFTIRVFDQLQGRHIAGKATHWFSQSNADKGWTKYVSIAHFMLPNSGFLLRDACLVEADVCVRGIVNAL